MTKLHLLLAIAIACMWGLNFSVIKLGVSEIDPLILTGLRFTFATFPVIFFIKKPQTSLFVVALYGVTFGVGVWGMLTLSIHSGLSAGVSSLILQSSAFVSVLLGVVFLKEKLNMTRKIGLLISILGLLLIFTLQDGSITLVGSFLACCAAISFSAIGLIIKKVIINDMFSFVVWSCAFAPLPLFILSLLVNGTSGFSTLVDHINYYSVFSVLFQAYPVTVLGYWLWNKLLTQYPMSTMAPITLLIPIFGLLGSMVFYNEPLGFTKLLASLLIIFGVFIGLSERLIQKIRTKII